jgi:ABC-type multidrug transport system ATPase subunit
MSVDLQPAKPLPSPVARYDSTGTIRIGRSADNDIVLPDLWVSNRHAEIRHVDDRHYIVDLGSTNGLHRNGRRIVRGLLIPGDRFTIGRHEFVFDGQSVYRHDDQGPMSLIADDLTVDVDARNVLDDISFALHRGTLLGVVGPSGSGTSTLLQALTGMRPVRYGRVLYDGRDLKANYAELRDRIGWVPKDDAALHGRLTVGRALRLAASLRFANDVSRRQRHTRVDEVIDLLGLRDQSRQRIDTLSDGQRKRTSIALELLTDPTLLALDDPASGLDPALERALMRELRLIADGAATVVVAMHSMLYLELCDHVLVLGLGGRMGYFGPPNELLAFFEVDDFADVFEKMTGQAQAWAQRYRNSDTYRRYVGDVALELLGPDPRAARPREVPTPRAAADGPTAATPVAVAEPVAAGGPVAADGPLTAGGPVATVEPVVTGEPAPAGSPPTGPALNGSAASRAASDRAASGRTASGRAGRAASGRAGQATSGRAASSPARKVPLEYRLRHPLRPVRQFLTLCLRTAMTIWADRYYAAFLLGLPLGLAALTRAVPGGLAPDPVAAVGAQRLLLVLVIGAAFMGVAVAVREIVNERAAYRRERVRGLSASAYLGSKIVVLAVIDAIMVLGFVELALLMRPKPVQGLVLADPVLDIAVAVTLVAIASSAFGLLASALVRTSEQTAPILVLAVMAQLVLSGGLFAVSGPVLQVASVIAPTRWGLAATAATTHAWPPPLPDPLWNPTPGSWWRACLLLVAQTILALAATRLALRRLERPGPTRLG